MWSFIQRSGQIINPEGVLMHRGYSGSGEGRNNPDMENVARVGPIPKGRWRIGKPYDSAKVGPYALPLTPFPGTITFGRASFLIHGDSKKNMGAASKGCIICPRTIRELIVASGDTELVVI